eukprot:scaffold298748_cov42-Prasinocladus_malaysianus.AAC.1
MRSYGTLAVFQCAVGSAGIDTSTTRYSALLRVLVRVHGWRGNCLYEYGSAYEAWFIPLVHLDDCLPQV